jgi:hypothetical protein
VSLLSACSYPHARRLAVFVATVAAVLVAAPAALAGVRLVAPVGADAGNCAVTPCASFSYAYGQAAAGDVITVAPGSYGGQTVPGGSKAVTFKGLPGNKIRQLHSEANNITFDGLDLDAGGTKTTGAVFEHGGASNVTLKNSSVGNVVDEKGAMLGGTELTTNPTGVVIDNVLFHDVVQQGDAVHNECLMSHAPGITIRNSTFWNCATMDISLGRGDWYGQQPYGNVTLENNVFGHTINGNGWHYYGLAWFVGEFKNARVVNNTFENSVHMEDQHVGGGPYSGVWANNIGDGWQCLPGVTYTGNIGKACGGSDRAMSPSSSCAPPACSRVRTMPIGWLDPAHVDFRLAPTSPAVNAGTAAYAPPTDRTGLLRDSRPDAGAYEFGAGLVGAPGGAWRLRLARLHPRVICRHAHKKCPSSTKLRLRLGRPARVSIRVQRLRKGGHVHRVRTLALRKVRFHKARRIRAAGLKAGRYRVVVQATDRSGARSAPKRLKLRVR